MPTAGLVKHTPSKSDRVAWLSLRAAAVEAGPPMSAATDWPARLGNLCCGATSISVVRPGPHRPRSTPGRCPHADRQQRSWPCQPDRTPARRHTSFVVVGLLPRPGSGTLIPRASSSCLRKGEQRPSPRVARSALQLVLVGDTQREVSVSHGPTSSGVGPLGPALADRGSQGAAGQNIHITHVSSQRTQ